MERKGKTFWDALISCALRWYQKEASKCIDYNVKIQKLCGVAITLTGKGYVASAQSHSSLKQLASISDVVKYIVDYGYFAWQATTH